MEELDLLKKAWKKDNQSFHQVTENEIYKMIHKRSSSIVKWILVVGIIELLFWTFLGFFTHTNENLKAMHAENMIPFFYVANIINFGIILWFIYMFYKNYTHISVIASTKELMQNILKTRKTVQYYVWYNLGIIAFNLLLVFGLNFIYNPKMDKVKWEILHDVNLLVLTKIIIMILISLVIFVGFFWLFYKLLYGIFMRKLINNYKELKKMEL